MTLRGILSKVKDSEVKILIKGQCFNCTILMEDGWNDTSVLSDSILNRAVDEISTVLEWGRHSNGEEYIAGILLRITILNKD